jgi:hypothetical protein
MLGGAVLDSADALHECGDPLQKGSHSSAIMQLSAGFVMSPNQLNEISQAHQPSPLHFAVCGMERSRQNQLQALSLHLGGLGLGNRRFQSQQVFSWNPVRFWLCARPATTEAAVRIAKPDRKIRRAPKTSASLPPSNRSPPKVMT